jgi:hypothetical protein
MAGHRLFLTVLGTVCLLAVAGQARAYGLFACYDPAAWEVCLVDTGTRTGFVPSDVCNATCPACAGRCSAVRRFPKPAGHWVETWSGTPGMGGNNRLVPGPEGGWDARTILRNGLVAPGTPSATVPPPSPTGPREHDLQ